MRCIRGLVILAGALTVLAPAALRLPAGQAAGQTQVSVSGYITDTLCGRKGATPNHVECAKRSVASGNGSTTLTAGAKYALYDERTKNSACVFSNSSTGR